jgi:endogenous inhibitor of DNA gyrase (YacG/DUF329 family)
VRCWHLVQLFGCGNWSGVNCPKCGADVEDWWKDAMDKAWAPELKNLSVSTPFCGHSTTLNDLNYVWPAGFSRFVLEAMKSNISQTTAEQDQALSEALGLKLWERGPFRKIKADMNELTLLTRRAARSNAHSFLCVRRVCGLVCLHHDHGRMRNLK